MKIQTIDNIDDVITLAAKNPNFARQLKDHPSDVAKLLGVALSEKEAELISENLDIEQLLRGATGPDSFAAKVAQGIGLRTRAD